MRLVPNPPRPFVPICGDIYNGILTTADCIIPGSFMYAEPLNGKPRWVTADGRIYKGHFEPVDGNVTTGWIDY